MAWYVPLSVVVSYANIYPSPGRYYAAAVIKVILAQIILHYDCELVQPEAPRWFTWRSSMLPKESTLVTFVARDR